MNSYCMYTRRSCHTFYKYRRNKYYFIELFKNTSVYYLIHLLICSTSVVPTQSFRHNSLYLVYFYSCMKFRDQCVSSFFIRLDFTIFSSNIKETVTTFSIVDPPLSKTLILYQRKNCIHHQWITDHKRNIIERNCIHYQWIN